MPIPVILDTDIGTDIDDTWALAMLIRSPELDLKLALTGTADTAYRARIAAKLLQIADRPDVPVGIGLRFDPGGEFQAAWLGDYRLESYPGTVHEDGVAALIETVRASADPVTIIAIGPLPNLRRALELAPDIAGRCRLVGMHGSLDRGYGPGSAPVAEANVRNDVEAARTVFAAPWRDILLTPLDTCDDAILHGDRYRRVLGSSDPLVRAVVENYRVWQEHVPWNHGGRFEDRSSTLFDTVAVYLAYCEEHLAIEEIKVRVTDDGYTVRDDSGSHVRAAVRWTDLEAYLDHLTTRMSE